MGLGQNPTAGRGLLLSCHSVCVPAGGAVGRSRSLGLAARLERGVVSEGRSPACEHLWEKGVSPEGKAGGSDGALCSLLQPSWASPTGRVLEGPEPGGAAPPATAALCLLWWPRADSPLPLETSLRYIDVPPALPVLHGK